MPFKSAAQRRKFAELLVQGKISADTYEEWNRETGGKRLPEHVTPKRRSATGAKTKKTKKTKKKTKKTGARRNTSRPAPKRARRARKAAPR